MLSFFLDELVEELVDSRLVGKVFLHDLLTEVALLATTADVADENALRCGLFGEVGWRRMGCR